jgi:hypothetical protein
MRWMRLEPSTIERLSQEIRCPQLVAHGDSPLQLQQAVLVRQDRGIDVAACAIGVCEPLLPVSRSQADPEALYSGPQTKGIRVEVSPPYGPRLPRVSSSSALNW